MDNIFTDNEIRLREKLYALRLEHQDLDDVIKRISEDPGANQFQISRLKKRKLYVKDSISKIENQLIPDEPA